MKFTVDLKVTTQVGKMVETPDEIIKRLRETCSESGRLEITGFVPHKDWSKDEGRYRGKWVMVEGTVEPKEDEGPNLTAFYISYTIGKVNGIDKPATKSIKLYEK